MRDYAVGSIIKPLWFNYEDDSLFFKQGQFLLGNELMVSTVLEKGDDSTNSTRHVTYFPKNSIFYEFNTGEIIKSGDGKSLI